jgi:hypothetical protein
MDYKNVKVTRQIDTDSDSSGSDYKFDDGTGTDPTFETVIENYPCKIVENAASYNTSEQGESYTGSAHLIGMLTNKLKEGDIIDGQYKIVGPIKKPFNRKIKCSLVRLS